MVKKMTADPFSPIPSERLSEWERLVKQGKTLVGKRDASIWKLVLLSSTVSTKYGEEKVKRFADEIGLSVRTIHEYRWLARAGVDEEFLEQWKGLSYTMVRTVLRHTGKVANPSTEYFLKYALERNVTVQAMNAYMLDTVAPDRMRERAAETIKMALQDKQESEGFSDYIKTQLEKIAEEHPELEDTILRSAIVDVEALEELKVAAGIATDEEEKMAAQASYQTQKLKRYYTHLTTVKADLIRHLEYGHENADDLRFVLGKLRDVVDEVLKAEQIVPEFNDDDVDDVTKVINFPLTAPPSAS